MRGSYTTLYCRREFTLSDPMNSRGALLRVRSDDGFVAYVNGEEVGRVNAGASGHQMRFDAVASGNAAEPLVEHQMEIPLDLRRAGPNVLALQGLNRSLTESSDFRLNAALEITSRPDPDRDRSRFEAFRTAARGKTAARRIAYFESRLLERAGRDREAAAAFRRLCQDDPEAPEPLERLVESLRRLGKNVEAERLLEKRASSTGE